MSTLTQQDLRGQRCQEPGCHCGGEMFFHAKCHEGKGLDVSYLNGVLYIVCHKCQGKVAQVAVKEQ